MKRTNLGSIFILTFVLGACAPDPQLVSIDYDSLTYGEVELNAEVSGPSASRSRLNLKGSVASRPSRILEEKEGAALWAEARATLAANRERSLERFRSDLERKFMGEARAKAIEAEKANEEADNAAWEMVLTEVAALMERYAGEKTELSADLAGRIGFPDKGQSISRRRREEVYAEMRAEKVEQLRKQLGELDDRFEAELNSILVDYQRQRQQRLVDLLEMDYASDQAAIARAEAEAQKVVREVIGQVDAAMPELQKRLAALGSESVTGASASVVNPDFETETWTRGLSRQDLEKYAMVFVKSRGYELSSSRKAKDVTEEFKKWLTKNAVSR